MAATVIITNADSILAGTLDVAVLGDAPGLFFGDSFVFIEGASFHGDALPLITGEFDRLFLPNLPDGLFFEVEYGPSAVRLVVVPTHGAWMALGLPLGLAGRRRRSTLAES